jgi:hypothetical protein
MGASEDDRTVCLVVTHNKRRCQDPCMHALVGEIRRSRPNVDAGRRGRVMRPKSNAPRCRISCKTLAAYTLKVYKRVLCQRFSTGFERFMPRPRAARTAWRHVRTSGEKLTTRTWAIPIPDKQGEGSGVSPAAPPVASPMASPMTSPMASLMASLMASPMAAVMAFPRGINCPST